MSASPTGPERVRFRDGQLLAAHDLTDDAEHEEWMRALHVRAMHDTWGVASGFALAVDKLRRGVDVGPGVAYDYRGRAIVLADELHLTAPKLPPMTPPPQPGMFPLLRPVDLVCSYRGGADIAVRRHGVGCAERSMVELAALRWVFPPGPTATGDRIRLGEDVPLGTFGLDKDGKLYGPYLGTRRNARARLRPRIGTGMAALPEGYKLKHGVTVQHKIHTSAAEFTTTPQYFAWLSGVDVYPSVLPLLSIVDPTPTYFYIDLVFGLLPGPDTTDEVVLGEDASLFWVGVEPYAGCPPTISFELLQAILEAADLFH